MKTCGKCHETKPLKDFSPSNMSKDGRQNYCKPCAAQHRREERIIKREGKKTCKRCGEIKPLQDFYAKRYGGERYQSWCKVCQKAAIISGYNNDPEKHAAYNREWGRKNKGRKADIALKTRLGVPHGTYERMLAEQGGQCAICGTTNPGSRINRFHVDHAESTGRVRGLLCGRCNMGIGQLFHDEAHMAAALAYIKKHI